MLASKTPTEVPRKARRRRTKRPRRRRAEPRESPQIPGARLVARASPSRHEPLPVERAKVSPEAVRTEPREEEAQGRPNPQPEESAQLPTPEEHVRRGAVAPLVGLDEEGQTRDRVAKRIGEIARSALPPPINDPPGYPELILDEEGNHTWHFYYLVAKIRPDGTVFFYRDNGYMIGKGRTGRYCNRLSTEPGTCEEQATVPWPEDWGTPIGRFPENVIKLWFLRQTVALRDELSDLSHRQSLSGSISAVDHHADGIWCDASLSKRSRRRLLFELWDECEEPADDDDRRPVARVGQSARDRIVRFIKQEIPRDSPDAYTLVALRAFNASRASRQLFAPYE